MLHDVCYLRMGEKWLSGLIERQESKQEYYTLSCVGWLLVAQSVHLKSQKPM
jgi:hypothetical protein